MPTRAADGALVRPLPRRPRERMVRLPGVYRPQPDSWLLAAALREAGVPRGGRVLDLCCGTGILAVTAARAGAGEVVAVDVARGAVAATWLNARLRGHTVRARRGGVARAVAEGPFDVVVANPPYVPAPAPYVRAPAAGCGSARAWDAGHAGRLVLDPLCAAAVALLANGGFLLLVQSEVSDVDRSVADLQRGGLAVSVCSHTRLAFGPVMRARAPSLAARGVIGDRQRTEEVAVIRADRT